MIYVTSDLHGLKLESLKALLKKANFGDDDWLFILGDVVDKQNDGGVEILLWLLEQANAQLILGNHEAMLLSCDFLLDEITEDNIKKLDCEKMELLTTYLNGGGAVTLKALKELKDKSPENLESIFEYLREAPLYETVEVGEKDFLLCHAGIGNFRKDKKLSEYEADDFLWTVPSLDDEFYDDIITVFGHYPTRNYAEQYNGKIIRTKTWIDIDMGVACGNSPVLLCLDTLKEYYL